MNGNTWNRNVKKMSAIQSSILLTSVVISLLSNIVGVKIINLRFGSTTGGVFLFPVMYILSDVAAECYGYAFAKKIIKVELFYCIFASVIIYGAILLPAAPHWEGQEAFVQTLGSTPRIMFAGYTGMVIGGLLNAKAMEIVKKLTKGKYLWIRTIVSTILGELADTFFFVVIGFWLVFPWVVLRDMIVFQTLIKIAIEVMCTPLTYLAVNKVKTKEGED